MPSRRISRGRSKVGGATATPALFFRGFCVMDKMTLDVVLNACPSRATGLLARRTAAISARADGRVYRRHVALRGAVKTDLLIPDAGLDFAAKLDLLTRYAERAFSLTEKNR